MVLNCNVMLIMSDTLVVEKEQFWRMICCSRLVGTCLAVDLIQRKCSNSHRHVSNPREIEKGIAQIPWEKFITSDDTVGIRTVVSSSLLDT